MTDHELRFIEYWEKNREKEKKITKQWYIGLPIGLAFAVPIAINFSSGWYKRAQMTAMAEFNPMVLVVALLIIITFIAIFYKRHQWDMNEQRYKEFVAKKTLEEQRRSQAND
ncbi:hypothetical protein [Pinibacter aurantiacus]|uniref:Uncharacterized protein n=1 Tax=Pinibacter aurantiacus TaxID=2851599 RepID=A0A9E2SAI2_9BACT|nr:hypothetical protein [Pinibacter aurantiacus]MBV4359466.1 hypothetical protein [Pinibacter aurantiacus]